MPVQPLDYPVSATASRPQWADLPPAVRRLVESRCEAPVTGAWSVPTGFTAGFASRLRLADGTHVFVKAAGRTGDPWRDHAIDGYREEARKVVALPAAVPAPRLRWTYDAVVDGGDGRGGTEWVVLCFDDVGGRPPYRPWRTGELDLVLDCLERAADALTPAPTGSAGADFATDFADEAQRWAVLAEHPLVAPYVEAAQELCAVGLAGAAGDSLVHCDLRDDNVVIGAGGRVWLCDWSWPLRGAPWIDTVTLLLSARGDGVDTDQLLARRRLTTGVPADVIDGFLALMTGFWLVAADDPVPPSSPWIRVHQRWYGRVAWEWLAARRGWT